MPNLHTLIGPETAPSNDAPTEWLIVMLHGVGQDGSDLLRFASVFQTLLPGAYVTAPHAPHRFDLGRTGRQWFSLQGLGPNTRLEGVQRIAPVVERFIDARIAKTGVAHERIVMCGFSQGAMIALYVGLRRKPPPLAILAHSGMVVEEAVTVSQTSGLPSVLLTHGGADDVISPSQLPRAEALLRAASVPVEAHRLPGLGHVINEDVLTLSREFLERTLRARGERPRASGDT
jgi:phospholipase/carboxylesterase